MLHTRRLDSPRIHTLRDEIVAAVPCQKPGFRKDLAALSMGAVFTVYVNWADRFVPARPRRVILLDGFWTDEALRLRDDVLEIVRKIEVGADLTRHLSSLVDFRGYAPSRYDEEGRLIGSKWRDKDFALNAYNVHHLHFGERPARSDELLFVEFTRDTAVLVMVGDHKSFDGSELERRILEARARNGHELKGILGPASGGYTAAERNELARAGISTCAVVDGKVVIAASISTAGTSDYTSLHAGRMLRALREFDSKLDDPQWTAEMFDGARIERPKSTQFEWLLNFTNLVLIERGARIAFPIVEGRRGLPATIEVEDRGPT